MKIVIKFAALLLFTFIGQARATTVPNYGTGVGLVLQMVCHPKTGVADVQFAEFNTLTYRTKVYYYNVVNAEICPSGNQAPSAPSSSFRVYGPHLQKLTRNRVGVVKDISDIAVLTENDAKILRGLQLWTGSPAKLQEAWIIDNRYIQAGLSDQYPDVSRELFELAEQPTY